jgi:hypothetical protein
MGSTRQLRADRDARLLYNEFWGRSSRLHIKVRVATLVTLVGAAGAIAWLARGI